MPMSADKAQMDCPLCGKAIPMTATFCPYCGQAPSQEASSVASGERPDRETEASRQQAPSLSESDFPVSSRTKAIRASMVMYNPKEVAEFERCGKPFRKDGEEVVSPEVHRAKAVMPLRKRHLVVSTQPPGGDAPPEPTPDMGRAAEVASHHAQRDRVPDYSLTPPQISERRHARRWPIILGSLAVLVVAGALVIVIFFPQLIPWR